MNTSDSQPISTQKNILIEIVTGYFLAYGIIRIILLILLFLALILVVWIAIF